MIFLLTNAFTLFLGAVAPTTTSKPPEKHELIRPKLIIPPQDKAKSALPIGDLYFYPGVMSESNGRWFGTDNFLNLPKTLAVQVNFLKSGEAPLPFSQEKFQSTVMQSLEEKGVHISLEGSGNKPPLPLFNLVILILPAKDGFAASCQGRLLEHVELSRIRLEKGAYFQAITWEQSNLVVGPEEEFERLLSDAIGTIIDNFAKRFKS